ncbi:DUF4956 domain-containing protein [Roseivirga pacifica]
MELTLTTDFLINLAKFWYSTLLITFVSLTFYYKRDGKTEYVLTNIMLSAVVFMICVLIRNVELSLGFALGIFAIFGIIRYRTAQITAREMTYIFLAVGIAAKNALVPNSFNYLNIVVSDISLIILLALGEYIVSGKEKLKKKVITYGKIELIHPDKRALLKEDLNNTLGLDEIVKVKIGKVNFVEKSARLEVQFKDKNNNHLPTE